ncbi:MAG: pentapeptide repeat-containing protein, partial [Leptolyngbya sp. RL_3_1]|nr:pentapeptide repeat-containing protein [Leptolyngbya sp. RL_3_1]
MRERFKQWQPQIRPKQWWVMGAIATPVFVWMVGGLGLLPDHRVQPDGDRLAHTERATPAHPDREAPVRDLGAIAAVVGGVFLLVNCRMARSPAETADLSRATSAGPTST